jgi:outer membrane protein assembly factor BamB
MQFLCFSLLLLFFSSASAQQLEEMPPIEFQSTIKSFRVETSPENSQCYLFVFLDGNSLNVYNPEHKEVISVKNANGFVFWENTYLHGGKLYFFSQGLEAINFGTTKPVVEKISSKGLKRTDYYSIQGAIHNSSSVLLASYDLGVDVYSFPSLELITQLKRDEARKGTDCLLWDGNLITTLKQNQLVGYNIESKQISWTLNTGTSSPKFMGISMGTFPKFIVCWKINPQDKYLYAGAVDGTLYKFDTKTGKIVIEKPRFRGSSNNAGLLTNFNFVDVNGDGKNELVAPSVDNNVYCLNPQDFSVLWAYDTGNECQMPLAFCDVTRDNIPEIFVVNDYDFELSIIEGKGGKPLLRFPMKDKSGYIQINMAIADQGANSFPELFMESASWKKIRPFRIKSAEPSKR